MGHENPLSVIHLRQWKRVSFNVLKFDIYLPRLHVSIVGCVSCGLTITTSRQPSCEPDTCAVRCMLSCLGRLTVPSRANDDKMEADGRCVDELDEHGGEQQIGMIS
jgi:hypothetical protein